MFFTKQKYFFTAVFILGGVLFAAPAYADTISFNVDPTHDSEKSETIAATSYFVGEKARWYISDQYFTALNSAQQTNLLADVRNVSQEFDAVIYPYERALFGSEPTPGIDNDPKIFILLSQLIDDAGGYFREQDGFARDVAPNSNEHEMLYLNIRYMGSPRMRAFLAHEFQHLITFNQKRIQYGLKEDVWMNEMRSELAPTLLGYDDNYKGSNLEARVSIFLKNPVDSLLNWQNKAQDYGSVNLFGQYVLDHYGRSVIASMVENRRVGVDSFNEALRAFGFKESFSDVFTNWSIALLVNNCSYSAGIYCFLNPSLSYGAIHVPFAKPGGSGSLIDVAQTSYEWEANWFEFFTPLKAERPEKHVFHLNFDSPINSGFRIPIIVYKEDGVQIREIGQMNLAGGKGEFSREDFGFVIPRIVIIPSNQYSIGGTYGENAPRVSYNFTASLLPKLQELQAVSTTTATSTDLPAGEAGPQIVQIVPQLPDFPDGTLLRARDDYKVYIIKGPSARSGQAYKRWIQNSKIFEFYPHLSFDAVKVVEQSTLALYKDSYLVRKDGDSKVYEINGDGTRHWLDMTP
ncbi:MAG: hypothetical protein HYS15_02875, partial [Candidatus Spechtbacteria bacterium]|nr:hypothetical protein [Candidatus Spechtbacteria bacterium]